MRKDSYSDVTPSKISKFCNLIIFDPLWIFGVAVAAFSVYVNGIALNYGSAVFISSTAGVTVAINDIFAWLIFGENF